MPVSLGLSITIGGAYHSHWFYFGTFAKSDNPTALETVLGFSKRLKLMMLLTQGLGLIPLAIAIAFHLTVLPPWFFFLTPLVLIWLLIPLKHLPQPLLLLAGGWGNLVYTIYFGALLVYFSH